MAPAALTRTITPAVAVGEPESALSTLCKLVGLSTAAVGRAAVLLLRLLAALLPARFALPV
jgi:hypothetical protein